MTEAGQHLVDFAKSNRTLEALNDVQASVVPADLQNKLDQNGTAAANFQASPPSSKRKALKRR